MSKFRCFLLNLVVVIAGVTYFYLWFIIGIELIKLKTIPSISIFVTTTLLCLRPHPFPRKSSISIIDAIFLEIAHSYTLIVLKMFALLIGQLLTNHLQVILV